MTGLVIAAAEMLAASIEPLQMSCARLEWQLA
jgi:hypothetical protein